MALRVFSGIITRIKSRSSFEQSNGRNSKSNFSCHFLCGSFLQWLSHSTLEATTRGVPKRPILNMQKDTNDHFLRHELFLHKLYQLTFKQVSSVLVLYRCELIPLDHTRCKICCRCFIFLTTWGWDRLALWTLR